MPHVLTTVAARPATDPSESGWVAGEFVLRVHGTSRYERPVRVRRSHGLIGRAPGCDVVLDDAGVEPAHVYLHLDQRGLFAVDLATRGGSRIGAFGEPSAWLRVGEMIEVAGFHVEMLGFDVDRPDTSTAGAHFESDTRAGGVDLLDGGAAGLEAWLHPEAGGPPLALRSALVFAGSSQACGLVVEDSRAAPVQCVLVRSERGVWAVDLASGNTRLNGAELRDAGLLSDGDELAMGAARFRCRIAGGAPAVLAKVEMPAPARRMEAVALCPRVKGEAVSRSLSQAALERLAHDDQDVVLAWIVAQLRTNHEELMLRHDALQRDMMRALRKMQRQQTTVHCMQLERLEHLSHEVSLLRDEVRRRYGSSAAPARVEPPRALPSVAATASSKGLIDETNAWLARRVDQIQKENQAARRAALKKGV